MPEDIYDLILDAWQQVEPRLLSNPAELSRRLARRNKPTLTRPPRAWCLAVRASDHRIPTGSYVPEEHEVTLDSERLRKLCAPIYLDPPGQQLDEVAKKLGTTPMGLLNARLKKIFDVHHVEGLGGRWGRPHPLLFTRKPLDAGAKDFASAMTDPLWGITADGLADRIPPDLSQTLTRVPYFRPAVWKHRYQEDRHPELEEPQYKYRNQRLPPPEPDYVWYKWSISGHFLGDDPSNWRDGPNDPGERPPRWRAKPWRHWKRKRRPSVCDGTDPFNGFRWKCPSCGKTCRTAYFPMPPVNLLIGEQPMEAFDVTIPRRSNGFACARCHRVRFFSSISKDYWNDVISYVTAGLLYGHEVPRPEWAAAQRKREYTPRPNAKPSLRRPQVTELLLQGLRYAAIGQKLGLSERTINDYAGKIYRHHNIRGRNAREQLARKLNRPTPPSWTSKKDQVRMHLAAGLTTHEIAARMGITKKAAEHHMYAIRRAPSRQHAATPA